MCTQYFSIILLSVYYVYVETEDNVTSTYKTLHKNIHLQYMALTYNYSNDIIDYEMTARESSGESGSVVLCQSMYIPVETSEPGVTSSLLQLVNEMFFCLFLSHFQNQSISGGREGEGEREGGRTGGRGGEGEREEGRECGRERGGEGERGKEREEGRERERGRGGGRDDGDRETPQIRDTLYDYIYFWGMFAVI